MGTLHIVFIYGWEWWMGTLHIVFSYCWEGRKEEIRCIYDTNLIYTSMFAMAVRAGCSDLNLLTLLTFLYTVAVLPREQDLTLRYPVYMQTLCSRLLPSKLE